MQVSNAIAPRLRGGGAGCDCPDGLRSLNRRGPSPWSSSSIAQVGQIFHVYQKGQKPPPQGLKDL